MKVDIDVPDGQSGNWKVKTFVVSKKDEEFQSLRSFQNRGCILFKLKWINYFKYFLKLNIQKNMKVFITNNLKKDFVAIQNEKLLPMNLQLNSLLTHPVCTKNKCFCGQKKCYYSPLFK